MGRLQIVKRSDSSPSSAESSFRELDEVFLQSQTRIWLGEVLNTRLDEDLHISDLLQDGEILYEVSKVVWDLLLAKCMELRHLKHRYGPFGSKKSSGRYRPYSNVDSFIKVCKILGLSGIDLFSPSDVVEKRDIRKVCICIRALSKKSRSKQLKVPDFDMVVYSVSMPTDMVGGIRRSLESSQYTLSSSSSYSSHKVSPLKPTQEKKYSTSDRDDESSSDESDEAESRYMGENSFSPTHEFDDAADGTHSDNIVGDSSSINLGERNYISDYLAFSDLMVHSSDGSGSAIPDGESNMYDFFLNADSQGSTSKKKYSDDEEMEVSSTTSMSSVLCRMLNLDFDDQFDAYESSTTNVYSSGSMKHEAETENTETVGTLPPTEALNSEEAKFEMAPRTPDGVSTKRIQNKCEVTGHCSDAENDYCWENGEGDLSNNNQDTPLSVDKDNETISPTMLSSDSDLLQSECSHISSDLDSSISDVTSNYMNSSCNKESVHVSEKSHTQHQFITAACVSNGSDTTFVASGDQENNSESIFETSTCKAREADDVSDNNHYSFAHENGNQDKTIQNPDNITESIADERKGTSPEIPAEKRGRKPLLKTVVKGTAIAGVLFLLLHIRRSSGSNAQENKESNKSANKKDSRFSFVKQHTGSRGKGIYPSDKIKL